MTEGSRIPEGKIPTTKKINRRRVVPDVIPEHPLEGPNFPDDQEARDRQMMENFDKSLGEPRRR